MIMQYLWYFPIIVDKVGLLVFIGYFPIFAIKLAINENLPLFQW